MGYSIELMLTELDFRVHAAEYDVGTVVLTGAGGIEQFIIPGDKRLPPVRVFPNPFLERILDCLLFLLCEGRFLGVQHTAFLAVRVCYGVINAHVTQIQRVFQYLIGVGPVCPIGHIGVDITVGGLRFAGDVPLCRERRVVHLDAPAKIIRRLKGLHHKLLDIGLVNPGRTQADLDFRSVQVFGLCPFQRFYVVRNLAPVFRILGEKVKRPLVVGKFFTDVAGEKIIGGSPSIRAVGPAV